MWHRKIIWNSNFRIHGVLEGSQAHLLPYCPWLLSCYTSRAQWWSSEGPQSRECLERAGWPFSRLYTPDPPVTPKCWWIQIACDFARSFLGSYHTTRQVALKCSLMADTGELWRYQMGTDFFLSSLQKSSLTLFHVQSIWLMRTWRGRKNNPCCCTGLGWAACARGCSRSSSPFLTGPRVPCPALPPQPPPPRPAGADSASSGGRHLLCTFALWLSGFRQGI